MESFHDFKRLLYKSIDRQNDYRSTNPFDDRKEFCVIIKIKKVDEFFNLFKASFCLLGVVSYGGFDR